MRPASHAARPILTEARPPDGEPPTGLPDQEDEISPLGVPADEDEGGDPELPGFPEEEGDTAG